MVLHEPVNGDHHPFLADGSDNAEVRAASEGAIASGGYESVLR